MRRIGTMTHLTTANKLKFQKKICSGRLFENATDMDDGLFAPQEVNLNLEKKKPFRSRRQG